MTSLDKDPVFPAALPCKMLNTSQGSRERGLPEKGEHGPCGWGHRRVMRGEGAASWEELQTKQGFVMYQDTRLMLKESIVLNYQ